MKNKVTYFITISMFLSSSVFLQACSSDSSKTIPPQPSNPAGGAHQNGNTGAVGVTASYNHDRVIQSDNRSVNELLQALSENDLVFITNEDGTVSATLNENSDNQTEDTSNETLLIEDLSKLNRITSLLDQLIDNGNSSVGDAAFLVRESLTNRITLLEKLLESINDTRHPRRIESGFN